MSVGQTILAQLGGNKFIAMTGANNFVSGVNSLQFRIGRNSSKANLVRITLEASNTYKVEFFTVRGINCRLIAHRDTVYADALRSVFEGITGFRTSL